MESPAIRTDDLTLSFGRTRAVDGLGLEVAAGSVFGLLGPNGAGKTTTIRMLLGLLRPTRGRAEVLGLDVGTEGDRVRERVGALLEHSGLYERLTAEQNLEFYGRIWRMARAARRARIDELLGDFGLDERRHDRVEKLSRGMRQKLALARALLHHPAIVFLDEPTAGLDPAAAVALRRRLTALAENAGTTIFLTTHDLAEAERLCDAVGLIREGRIVALGPTGALLVGGEGRLIIRGRGFNERLLQQLRQVPGVLETSVEGGLLQARVREDADPAAVVRAVVEAGGAVEMVSGPGQSLEETYLELMESEPR